MEGSGSIGKTPRAAHRMPTHESDVALGAMSGPPILEKVSEVGGRPCHLY